MNPKQVIGIIFTILVLLLAAAGVHTAQTRDVVAEAARVPPAQPAAQLQAVAPASTLTQTETEVQAAQPAGVAASAPTGPVITQALTLRAGWNAIYLEVEPVNTSPLVNVGTTDDPIWVHEKSTMEEVFAPLAASGALESVWAWNVPTTRVDYIVDPTEGLWDEPGWRRYVPESKTGPDGASQGFLTNLLSLHANTAYLVKLKNDLAGTVTLPVGGVPVVQHQRWIKGSYNLAGFHITPGTPPTIATFTTGSPITETRKLNADGSWGPKLASTTALESGAAYLVYYSDANANAPDDYTTPLNIEDAVSDGLLFTRGAGGSEQSLTIKNLSSIAANVKLNLSNPTGAGVALWATGPVTANLQTATASIALGAGKTALVKLSLRGQTGAGEALLQVTSTELGTRWQLPVRAEPASLAGLWVGDVTVNDVSEGRLGTTDVTNGLLTVALRPQGGSEIRGAAELRETISGNTSAVSVTLKLTLPSPDVIAPSLTTGAGLYLRGYVFADTNQNGERDGAEPGFAGRTVTLTLASGVKVATVTGVDGLYLFENLATGADSLATDTPTGYTAAFPVTRPAQQAGQPAPLPNLNAWPQTVTLGVSGVTQVVYKTSTGGTVTRTDFPRYDATAQRVEPLLNFGYVTAYDAYLYTGACNNRLQMRRNLGKVLNGVLGMRMDAASLNPPRGTVNDKLLDPPGYAIFVSGPGGAGVACGEIVVGAPTRFANGAGSDFTFRLILRVNPSGQAAILPYYVLSSGQRVSSANFSITGPVTATNAVFGDTAALLDYLITIAPDDPLNPYKHKYQPDHDNLDAKFNEMNLDTVDPWLWESYQVRRRIKLEMTELPPYAGATTDDAISLDWGGTLWGGLYQEVLDGIHQNDITVKGYFTIRQALPWEKLKKQPYDGAAGGG